MKNIISLTKFLSLVLIKQKSTLFFVILSIIGVVISLLFTETNIGVQHKLFKDLVLSMNSLFLHLITIFFTFSLLEKFKQGSVSILPLSLNISRFEYTISLFLTIVVSTCFIFISFFVIDATTLYLIESNNILPFLLQLCLYYMSSILLSYIVITSFFLLSSSPIKSITVGLITFMVGNSIDELVFYYKNTSLEYSKIIIDYISYIFPNFSLFDIQTFVVNQISTDFIKIGIESTLYFLFLSLILLMISYTKFKDKKVIPNDS